MRHFGHSQNSNNLQLNWNDCLAMCHKVYEIKLKPFPPHIVSTVFVEFVQIRKPFEKRPFHFFFRPLFFQSLPTDDKDIKFFIVQ